MIIKKITKNGWGLDLQRWRINKIYLEHFKHAWMEKKLSKQALIGKHNTVSSTLNQSTSKLEREDLIEHSQRDHMAQKRNQKSTQQNLHLIFENQDLRMALV